MKDVRHAVLTPKFCKSFKTKEQNTNIPFEDLKADKDRFLKQISTQSFPLFGLSVIKAVVDAIDEDVTHHQGAEAIVEELTKRKYTFFDRDVLDLKATVDNLILDCPDCLEVKKIKKKVPSSGSENILQIPEILEPEVLLYADRKHQGFAKAYKRVESWAEFPDFKRKVSKFPLNKGYPVEHII